MYPRSRYHTACTVLRHESLDDSARISVYRHLPDLVAMLNAMPAAVAVGGASCAAEEPLRCPNSPQTDAAATPDTARDIGFYHQFLRQGRPQCRDGGNGAAFPPPTTYASAAAAAAPSSVRAAPGDASSTLITTKQQRWRGIPNASGRSASLHDSLATADTSRQSAHTGGSTSLCLDTSRTADACGPLSLPVGGAVSVVATLAEYNEFFTRCCCIDGLSAAEVTSHWHTAALFAGELLMGAVPRREPRRAWPRKHRRTCVDGAFVTRTAADAYSVGLIVTATAADPALAEVLDEFRALVNRDFSTFMAEVPIGAGLRRCALRLWWTPQEGRITPGAALPPVKAILEDDRWAFLSSGAMGQAGWPVPPHVLAAAAPPPPSLKDGAGGAGKGPVIFRGYNDLRMYLFRPSRAPLCGERMHPIPHAVGIRRTTTAMPPAATYRPSSPSWSTLPSPAATNAYASTHSWPASSLPSTPPATPQLAFHASQLLSTAPFPDCSIAPVPEGEDGEGAGAVPVDDGRLDGIAFWQTHTPPQTPRALQAATPDSPGAMAAPQTARLHVFFDDVHVTGTGEHLIAFETTVEENYRPFLPVLTANLSPFLVVAPGEC